MLKSKPSTFLGTALSCLTCAIVAPLAAQAQTPPPAIPESSLEPLVTQISTQLATRISTSSCPEIKALLAQVQASSGQPPDSSSMIGQTLIAINNSPKLRSIIISKLGEPMIGKMIECNLIPVDLLMSPAAPGVTPAPSPAR